MFPALIFDLNTVTEPSQLPEIVGCTLGLLKKRGMKLAVSSSEKATLETVTRLGIAPFVDAIVDGDTVGSRKPNPELFLTAADLLNVRPCDCLIADCSDEGIQAAFTGGFYSVGLGAAAVHTKADYRADFFSQIPEILGQAVSIN